MSTAQEALAEATQPDAPSAPPGRIVAGRYELLSILGRGGTSTVYRALHTFTHRTVALKILSPRHVTDRDLVDRFLREARAATALVHHNTVEVLDMGVDVDGEVYPAMELLEGATLFEVIERERPMGPTRLAELVLPILDVLATAHRMGIVHRDIKPENVMIASGPGGAERPVLLDFGIAKVIEATRQTENGVILGTPFYMSPEQISGVDDVGPPSDVWSMGVVLYEALAGEPPFACSSLPSLFMSIASNQRASLSSRMPAITEGWSAIVERALSTHPGDRFADAGELASAIRAELRGPTPLVPRGGASDTLAPPGASASDSPSELVSGQSAPRNAWKWSVATAMVVLAGVMIWSVTTYGVDAPTLARSESVEVAPAAAPPDLAPPIEPSVASPELADPALATPSVVLPSRRESSGNMAVAPERRRARPPRPVESSATPAVEPDTAPPRGLPRMATEW